MLHFLGFQILLEILFFKILIYIVPEVLSIRIDVKCVVFEMCQVVFILVRWFDIALEDACVSGGKAIRHWRRRGVL